jgi:hypothetical protein
MRPYLKNTQLKKEVVGWLKVYVGPEFKPHYCKTKQNKTKKHLS